MKSSKFNAHESQTAEQMQKMGDMVIAYNEHAALVAVAEAASKLIDDMIRFKVNLPAAVVLEDKLADLGAARAVNDPTN